MGSRTLIDRLLCISYSSHYSLEVFYTYVLIILSCEIWYIVKRAFNELEQGETGRACRCTFWCRSNQSRDLIGPIKPKSRDLFDRIKPKSTTDFCTTTSV